MPSPTEAPTAWVEQLVDLVDEWSADVPVPGFVIGITRPGNDPVLVARGVTSVEAPVDVDPSTLFQIGSTTKVVTATALMRLVEQDRVDLDVPVRRYVPELELADERAAMVVTLRHLLTHTAGHDGDYFDDGGGGAEALSVYASRCRALPQLAPVGAVWSYSNAGYNLIGRAIETVTGCAFEQAVAELVLEPLGMSRSFFDADSCLTRRAAVGHRPVAGQLAVTRPWALPRTSAPSGGLAASMEDQLRFAQFHLGDPRVPGGGVLTEATRRLMQAPQVQAGGGMAAHCGFAWLLQPTPGVLAHGGTTNGQDSAFVVVPGHGFGISVVTNSSLGSVLHRRVVKWVLREVCRVTPYRSTASVLHPPLDGDLDGRYESRLQTLYLEQTATGTGMLRVLPSVEVRRTVPDLPPELEAPVELLDNGGLRVTGGPLAGSLGEFLRDDHGTTRWLRLQGRIHRRAA